MSGEKTRTLKTAGCGTQRGRLVGFAEFAKFFHYGLDEFFGVGEFLGDHAKVHGGDGGVALAGAVDAVLADEDEGVGDAVERDGQAATVASEALLGVFEFVVVFVESRHGAPLKNVARGLCFAPRRLSKSKVAESS